MTRLNVLNPATDRLAFSLEMTSETELHSLVQRASSAQREWARVPIGQRAAVVQGFCDLLLERKASIAAEVTRQMGKPLSQAVAEVVQGAEQASYLASIAEESLVDRIIRQNDGIFRKQVLEPLGVILDIAVWNYPLLSAINRVAPAILAGNAAMIRHSSLTPLCAIQLQDAFEAAGTPPGIVTALTIDRKVASGLSTNPLPGDLIFSDPVRARQRVYRTGTANLSEAGLELGGNDPAYVRPDVDLDVVVPLLADGAFYNCGQSRCAVERIYVHRSIFDEFVERFISVVTCFPLGDPMADGTYIGPLAQRSRAEMVKQQVIDAAEKGARILTGGEATTNDGRGNYFEPTVLVDVDHSMTLMREQSFGPIIGLMAVDDDQQALELINDSEFSLSASIWTRDFNRAMQLGPAVQAGTLFLNRCDIVDPSLVWSGVKQSRKSEGSPQFGFREMTRLKSYHFVSAKY